jgi:hypothetical protein
MENNKHVLCAIHRTRMDIAWCYLFIFLGLPLSLYFEIPLRIFPFTFLPGLFLLLVVLSKRRKIICPSCSGRLGVLATLLPFTIHSKISRRKFYEYQYCVYCGVSFDPDSEVDIVYDQKFLNSPNMLSSREIINKRIFFYYIISIGGLFFFSFGILLPFLELGKYYSIFADTGFEAALSVCSVFYGLLIFYLAMLFSPHGVFCPKCHGSLGFLSFLCSKLPEKYKVCVYCRNDFDLPK